MPTPFNIVYIKICLQYYYQNSKTRRPQNFRFSVTRFPLLINSISVLGIGSDEHAYSLYFHRFLLRH
jgi:hypothetical protein